MSRVGWIGAAGVGVLCVAISTELIAQSDRDRAELRGPVASVSVCWQANHRDSYGEVEERERGSTTYDEAGNLVRIVELTPDFVRTRIPERHGTAVTILRSVMGNATEHYIYDAHGNLIERQSWYSDSAAGPPPMTERMMYDSAGHMMQRELFGEDGRRFGVTLYLRDARGEVVIEEDRPEGRAPPYPRMHYRYTHDDQGNWTTRRVTRENVAEDDYQYRYAGNLFRTIRYFDRSVSPQ